MGEFKSGFVHVLGPANVGKSTYINATVGAKVTVTSDKPQTTRNRIRCISTTENEQVVFLDTPGIHRPVNKLGKYLMKEARRALKGSDVLLYMVEPRGKISKYDQAMLDKLKGLEAPRILLLNKIDVYGKEDIARTLEVYSSEEAFDEYIPISALEGTNIDLAHRKLVA
ncbi:MAG: GTPase Era, partial [Candidatus Bipolaricaulota bacterium]